MRSRNKKGFTLLEVIIVVIIIAILASVALPRLIGATIFAKSGEALKVISALRESMEQCYALGNNSYTNCANLSIIGVTWTGKYFTVGQPWNVTVANAYSITFTGVNAAEGTIVYTQSANGIGNVSGTGNFIKIAQ